MDGETIKTNGWVESIYHNASRLQTVNVASVFIKQTKNMTVGPCCRNCECEWMIGFNPSYGSYHKVA